MHSPVEQIKEKLGIADVIGSYIKIEKAGGNYKARCPFHHEKNPSFFISPARNTFYCFGCGAKGDIFSFVELFEGIDFPGALKVLAEKAGVRLEFRDFATRDDTTKLFEIMEAAVEFYVKHLDRTPKAREYLTSRGLDEKSTAAWRLGFAPAQWRALYDHLVEEKKFPVESVEKVGLIKRSERGEGDRYYDRFRGRIMFPLYDSSGRVIAFSGRFFEAMQEDKEEAKYINSPETPLFSKSKILYGFHRAKFAIRKVDFSILVEGQMDLLLSHQVGFANSVALSGTAFTTEHVELLRRLSNNLVIALDADPAGIASAGKSAGLALAAGMDVKVALLPLGKDPADVIAEDKDIWRGAIRGSKHIIDFYLDYLSQSISDQRKLKQEVHRLVIPFIAAIPNKMDQAHFIAETARRLGIGEEPVRDEVSKVASTVGEAPTPAAHLANSAETPVRLDMIERKLLGYLFWQESLPSKPEELEAFRTRLRAVLGDELYASKTAQPTDVKNALIFEAELSFSGLSSMQSDIEELVCNLETEHLKVAFGEALGDLKTAEANKDGPKMSEALARCKEISDKLSKLASSH
jgi:DNA primase